MIFDIDIVLKFFISCKNTHFQSRSLSNQINYQYYTMLRLLRPLIWDLIVHISHMKIIKNLHHQLNYFQKHSIAKKHKLFSQMWVEGWVGVHKRVCVRERKRERESFKLQSIYYRFQQWQGSLYSPTKPEKICKVAQNYQTDYTGKLLRLEV